MRSISTSSAASVLAGTLFLAGGAAANPLGVPVAESPPLSCQTANFTVQTLAGFPVASLCGGLPCTDYGYTISSPTLNVDHAVFAVSATQNLVSTSPTSTVAAPKSGDTATGFLAGAAHEYAIRFNSAGTKSVEAHIFIAGQSRPRIGTVLLRSGAKTIESCLIATPGVTGDTFQPVFQNQTAIVAGGKCVANKVFDGSGVLVDVTTDTPGCTRASPTELIVNDATLRNNTSEHGITFGDGTSTCYGPPVPSKPICICSKSPCP